jgi:GNAT acetyltransferase-like protein
MDGTFAIGLSACQGKEGQVMGPLQVAARSEQSLAALSIDEVRDAALIWKSVTDRSPDAWFWHTWANMQFNLVAAQKYEARNLSFFVLQGGKPVGVVPLMVNRITVGDVSGWEASYYGAPLPWPAFLPGLPELETLENFAFSELETRVREAQAERIRLRLEPPTPTHTDQQRLEQRIKQNQFLDSSYVSHYMTLEADTLDQVRERYRRYVKKFGPAYELSIVDSEAVTSALEETYFHLHVKDAGGQFRSRESYTLQCDLARAGEAFFVVARNRGADVIAGMLLVSLYKGSAYDNSVAVDPAFQQEYVSHLLKWTAIEELLRRGAQSYELGPKAESSSFMALPSEKSRGISYFKEGWARHSVRRVAVAEKFLSARLLQAVMKAQADSLQEYFGVRG